MRSALGCAMAATLPFRRLAVTSRAVALAQLLDLELGPVEPLDARAVELLAATPEGDRLVEGDVPPLELRDDVVQLALELLEGALLAHGRTSSTRAPRAPLAELDLDEPPGRDGAGVTDHGAACAHDRVPPGERRARGKGLKPGR